MRTNMHFRSRETDRKNRRSVICPKESAFSLTDLLVLIALACVLGFWLLISHTGERRRIAQCTHNLKILGQAMSSFANDHGGSLPSASIKDFSSTWDSELIPYLQPGARNASSAGARKQIESVNLKVGQQFFCPSDPVKRNNPRSYAMSEFDMSGDYWPPAPDSPTGLGLVWDKENISRLLGKEFLQNLDKQDLDKLALIKLTWLPDPANTLLLGEMASTGNLLAYTDWTTVSSLRRQLDLLNETHSHPHNGRFNYLMVDGHVELLTTLQSGAMDGASGIWTITAGD